MTKKKTSPRTAKARHESALKGARTRRTNMLARAGLTEVSGTRELAIIFENIRPPRDHFAGIKSIGGLLFIAAITVGLWWIGK